MTAFDEMMAITKKPSDSLESKIERDVCKYAESFGILHYKFVSPAHRSVPDRIFFLPSGQVFLIEFKRKGKMPTEAQAREIMKLRERGVEVAVVDSVDLGKRVIDGVAMEEGSGCRIAEGRVIL